MNLQSRKYVGPVKYAKSILPQCIHFSVKNDHNFRLSFVGMTIFVLHFRTIYSAGGLHERNDQYQRYISLQHTKQLSRPEPCWKVMPHGFPSV